MSAAQLSAEQRAWWLSARKLGSSDAAAAIGIHPYKTRYQLWLEKTSDGVYIDENEAMRWGNLLEPVIAREFSRVSGVEINVTGGLEVSCGLYVHPEFEWMTATPDYLTPAGLPVEIKNASFFIGGKYSDGEIPDHVYVQLLHQMAVLGVASGYVAALIGGNKLVWRHVQTDDFGWLIEAEKQFWQLVEAKTPPPLSAGDSAFLGDVYPESNGETVEINAPDIAAALEQYEKARAAIKSLENTRDEAEAVIKAALGENSKAVAGEYRVNWSTVTSDRVDTKALKEAHPDIIKQFTKQTTTRRFSVSRIKE